MTPNGYGVSFCGDRSIDWKPDESYDEPLIDEIVILSCHFPEHLLCGRLSLLGIC